MAAAGCSLLGIGVFDNLVDACAQLASNAAAIIPAFF
jgi:hypothetical protein